MKLILVYSGFDPKILTKAQGTEYMRKKLIKGKDLKALLDFQKKLLTKYENVNKDTPN